MVGFYFEKRRAFATGIAVCGSGISVFLVIKVLNNSLVFSIIHIKALKIVFPHCRHRCLYDGSGHSVYGRAVRLEGMCPHTGRSDTQLCRLWVSIQTSWAFEAFPVPEAIVVKNQRGEGCALDWIWWRSKRSVTDCQSEQRSPTIFWNR